MFIAFPPVARKRDTTGQKWGEVAERSISIFDSFQRHAFGGGG
jgi:hypothetical protein